MAIESQAGPFISTLNPNYPLIGVDKRYEGAAHLRLIKRAVRRSFVDITGPVAATQASLSVPHNGYDVSIPNQTLLYRNSSKILADAFSRKMTIVAPGAPSIGGTLDLAASNYFYISVSGNDLDAYVLTNPLAGRFAVFDMVSSNVFFTISFEAPPGWALHYLPDSPRATQILTGLNKFLIFVPTATDIVIVAQNIGTLNT